VEALNSCATL